MLPKDHQAPMAERLGMDPAAVEEWTTDQGATVILNKSAVERVAYNIKIVSPGNSKK